MVSNTMVCILTDDISSPMVCVLTDHSLIQNVISGHTDHGIMGEKSQYHGLCPHRPLNKMVISGDTDHGIMGEKFVIPCRNIPHL